MEADCTSLSWEFCTHQDGMEELRYALFYTNLELETTIMSAKEEILRRECEIMNLRDLLDRAIKEKDEFEAKCGKLMLENLFLLEQHKNQELDITPQSDSDSSKIFDCSDSDDNATQSPQTDPIVGEPLLLKDLPPTVCKNACENEKPLLCQELPPTVCKNACENEKPLLCQELPPTVSKNACENEKPLLCQELPPTVCKNACENEKPLLSQELPPTVRKNAYENEKPMLSQELPPTVCKNACENEKPLLSQEHPPTVWKNACENEMPLLSQELPPTVHKNACENEKPLLSQEPPSSVWKNACDTPLPQKGKLLQAVIEAGPPSPESPPCRATASLAAPATAHRLKRHPTGDHLISPFTAPSSKLCH
ncbi:hypothetical protein SDJN02_21431 [Cucurbita argyrosperma subsp. argyrosperma]|nr:hypothetical protein SDJN02_21431 [Cucurbita argyrosperma subsp. argyrosperma]